MLTWLRWSNRQREQYSTCSRFIGTSVSETQLLTAPNAFLCFVSPLCFVAVACLFLAQDVAKCLLVCGVRYQTSQQQSSTQPRSSSALDTTSLAALEVAEVTALRFSRSRESDGEGGKSVTTALKVRQAAKSTSCVEKPAKRTGKKAQT